MAPRHVDQYKPHRPWENNVLFNLQPRDKDRQRWLQRGRERKNRERESYVMIPTRFHFMEARKSCCMMSPVPWQCVSLALDDLSLCSAFTDHANCPLHPVLSNKLLALLCSALTTVTITWLQVKPELMSELSDVTDPPSHFLCTVSTYEIQVLTDSYSSFQIESYFHSSI